MKILLNHRRLARFLASRNISQNRWAQRLGLDKGHLSQLVNGKRRYPSPGTRRKLLRGLDAEFDDLFEIELPAGSPKTEEISGSIDSPFSGSTFELEKGRFQMLRILRVLAVSLRILRTSPAFAITVILVLALAIGANCALFSIFDAVVLQHLPYKDPGRLFVLYELDRHRGTLREGVSVPDLLDLRERSRTFRQTSGIRFTNMTLTEQGDPIRLPTALVTENHFDVLGVEPILGRSFQPGDSQAGRNKLVLLSESLWIERFGGSPDVLSQQLILDGEAYQIIGVMPSRAAFFGGTGQIWVPLELDPEQWFRGMHILNAFARLPSSVTLEQAQEELDTIMAQLEADYPEENGARGAWLADAHEELVLNIRQGLWMLVGAVGCVLLIACVNVANLFLTRLNRRRSELALRAALGAGRWSLVGRILGEGFVLSAWGFVLGLGLAWFGTRLLVGLAPEDLPRTDHVSMNLNVLLFSVLTTLAAWLLVSLVPAMRFSGNPLMDLLKEGHRQVGQGVKQGWIRSGFVVAQVSLAIVLLVAAGLLLKSFWKLTQVDSGVVTENVLSLNFQVPGEQYGPVPSWPYLEWPAITQLQGNLLESVGALPGVRSAALSISNPLDSTWTTRVSIEGRPPQAVDEQEEAYFLPVSEGYFETLGIPLLKGRKFTPADDSRHPLVAVVNQAFADFYFPDGGDPLGERVNLYGRYREIIGVAGDVRFRGLTTSSYPAVYLPALQNPINSLTLVVRTEREPASLLPQIRGAAWRFDKNLAFFGVTTLDQFLSDSLGQPRFTLFLLSVFSLSAILLAVLGIYGVVSFLVAERTREIGIRMALGAGSREVLTLVVGRGMLAVGLGAVLGVLGALVVNRSLQSQLFQVGMYDPLTFLLVPLLLLLVGALACYVPARWATRLDPTQALRHE